MISKIKLIARNIVAGANIATIVVMLAVGYSDYINPSVHPLAATIGLAFPVMLLINLGFLMVWLIVCKRMIFIPIIGFIMCYVPIRKYIPFNIPHDTPIGCMKVLSFNVHGYVYDKGVDNSFETTMNYVKNSKADILCIQEDLGQWLNPKVHLDSIYQYSSRLEVGDMKMNAVSVYSKYKIIKTERIDYESKRNGSIACWLNVDGKTVIVINNHFESNHLTNDDKTRYKQMFHGDIERDTVKKETQYIAGKLANAAKLRAPQARAVANYIKSHPDYPIIVCGDFNDSPISYTHRTVADGLTDCYIETANGPGLSYNQKGFNVRIDNILCSSHFTPYNCRVDNKIHASDHYPIYCWLKFNYKP